MRLPSVAAVLILVATAACAPPGAKEGPELTEKARSWEAAINAGDVDGIAALYTDDARLLPPGKPMARGHSAVREEFGEMVAAGLKAELPTVEAMVAGDLGYRVGTYKLTSPDGATVDAGKYIEIWRKVGNEWKIVNDIWNSDAPADTGTVSMVFTHDVADSGKWNAAWQGENSRHEMFAEHGAPKVDVYQIPDKPKSKALVVHVADMAAFQAFMESDEVAAAKKADGVKDSTLRVYVKAAPEGGS